MASRAIAAATADRRIEQTTNVQRDEIFQELKWTCTKKVSNVTLKNKNDTLPGTAANEDEQFIYFEELVEYVTLRNSISDFYSENLQE